MNKIFASFERDGFILSSLVSKDFKLKYRRSVLGVLWSILNPLLMMVVLTAVFSFMFRFEIENFPLYLILGTILFNFMSNSTGDGLKSIIDAAPLIKKIRVNKVLFPLEKVLFELVNFVISLVAVVIVMVYFSVAPTANLLFMPLLLIYMVLFCTGLSLLLSALAVFFRDFIHLWSVITLAWTYATPLFYPLAMLPDWMQTAMQFNPMYQYVTYFREIVLWGATPSFTSNLVCLGMALVTLAIGIVVFRKLQGRFILYV
ncbi:MAG: ABC transporter permease [Coriobacteriales bacterium]|jgi:ABC-2 type transport system permease protein|nr:ABC transporter permease [Coriobacteriales bacterium]